jgi:hypothetical protein
LARLQWLPPPCWALSLQHPDLRHAENFEPHTFLRHALSLQRELQVDRHAEHEDAWAT